jgi:uncharacterized protein DUF3291
MHTEAMSGNGFQLAEANAAQLRFALDDPRMSEFVEAIARVNLLAESAAGFVWRLRGAAGHVPADDLLGIANAVLNVSVWRDYESLHAFTYRGIHGQYLTARARWFLPHDGPDTVLWWVPTGAEPTAEDAVRRLRYLRQWGATARAFTVLHRFDADGISLGRLSRGPARSST